MIRTRASALMLVVLSAAILSSSGLQAQVNVDVFSTFNLSGGGAPYSDLVGSLDSPDVMFATNTGFDWHPFGLSEFGADFTGLLNVAANGAYSFALNSDDGSLFFIDGGLVIDNGSPHAPNVAVGSATLAAGNHPFEVQFFECCGGTSGVDLSLATGVSFVPEPTSLVLLTGGVLSLCAVTGRFHRLPRRF